jgi:hypothetical protein
VVLLLFKIVILLVMETQVVQVVAVMQDLVQGQEQLIKVLQAEWVVR